MSLIDVNAVPQVAAPFMNDDHRAEATALNAVAAAIEDARGGRAGRDAVRLAWEALARLTRAHFAREERALGEARYPALTVHAAEHRLVLTAMTEEGTAFAQRGDLVRLREYVVHAMPSWFADHVETSDELAARWLAEH